MAEQLRLFVACELPEETLAALAAAQRELRERTSLRLRWVRPEGIHLTLKFLGEVEASRLEGITQALSDAVEPFELRLRPAALGSFGGRRLRVVWAGLEGDLEGLEALATCVDGALAGAGFERERRGFNAHLTLARVPDGLPASAHEELAGLIAGSGLREAPWTTLSQVSLVQSTLRAGGSVYRTLGRFPAS